MKLSKRYQFLGLFALTVLNVYAESGEWNKISEMSYPKFDMDNHTDINYTVHDHQKVVACFFNSWAYLKDGSSTDGQYDIESDHFDGNLCTHLVYKYGYLDKEALDIKCMNPELDITLGLYRKVVNLKKEYPHLKILIGIGGSHGSQKQSFNQLVNSHHRNIFIKNAVKFIRFDGMHFNWQFPHASDRQGYVILARECKEVFQKNQLLLTTTMAGFEETIRLSYDVFRVTRIFDLVFIQSYGYYKEKYQTGHQSPLHSKDKFKNTFDILEYVILKEFANTDNFVLGVPFYGEMYFLDSDNSSNFGLYQKKKTKSQKLGYGEVCKRVLSDNKSGNESLQWTMYWDESAKAAFAKSGNRWLTFNHPKAISEKVKLMSEWGMRGIMVSSIDFDDFKGHCSDTDRNTLLKTVNYALTDTRNRKGTLLCKELNKNEILRKFTPNSSEIISAEGSPLHVHCLAEGYPTKITWKKDGKANIPPYEKNSGHQIYFTNYTLLNCGKYRRVLSVLTVVYSTDENVGNYSCVVEGGEFQRGVLPFQIRLAINPDIISWWAGLAIFLMVLLIILPVCRIIYKKYKPKIVLSEYDIKQFQEGSQSKSNNGDIIVKEMENIDTLPYKNSYEIDKGHYNIDTNNVLGSGAFGVVFRGKVLDQHVAVKSVKNEGDRSSILSLLSELKIMIYLDHHPNIINLIGAHTSELRNGVVYVFVELCPHGNLLNYVRRNRESFLSLMVNDNYENVLKVAGVETDRISEEDLVNWSRQIASGLGYLRTKKIIHGDLAARNVLVFNKDCVKITDFGLSRKLYVYSNYKYQKSNYEEPLPWRWMALESLRDLEFSYESDIWSFGVTLWELFSLGEVPYAGMNWTMEFIEMLKNGNRITKPDYATSSLYDLLLKCWHQDQESRPKPTDLETFFVQLAKNFH